MKTSLFSILFLDVETVPVAPTFSTLPEEFQSLWAEKRYGSNQKTNLQMITLDLKQVLKLNLLKLSVYQLDIFFREKRLLFRIKSFYGHDEQLIK